ncbi:MAG: hypothetical protein H6745_16395 [Deltaproteobacteria bacterium]|nr:hypothetical protein [Deltaproteobacteria bacterium]
MNILRTSSAAALAVLGLAACSEGGAPAPAPASEGRLALGVQALTFPDVGDVAYHVAVRSALGPVWEADLRASRYGDGQSLSYVGPCDGSPAAQPHTVALRVDALYDAGGGALPASDWANPTAAGAIEVPAVCAPGEDVPVSFDLTLMRRASQGFFDIAVSFGEIFCSAKLDCEEDDHGPILLVHDPASGARVPTVVMALACVDPGATDLRLYLSDVALDCGFGPIAVDLSGGPGVLYDAADPAPAPILQALRFSGHQAYSDVGAGRSAEGAYVNLAVALDVDALDQRCTLAAEATAHDGALDDFTLPAASTYPVVTWQVDLTSPGEAGYSCTRHGLDDPDSGVGTAYKPAGATKTFAVVGHGDESDAFVLERRGGCTPSCAGRACGDDGCGGSCGSCDLGYCDLGVCNPDCSVALCGSGELAAPDGTCEPLSAPDDVVVSGTVLLDATSLTPGRAEPEQVSGRAKSVSGAIVTLTAAPPAGLAVGDEVLVINLMGSPAGVDRVGTHEIGLVAALDGPRVILTQPLRKVYATAGNSDLSAEVVRVVRVPVFRSLTLAAGAKLTASAFAPGGPGSGVVAVDVTGAVTFADASASISAAGLGYAGGAGGAHASGPNTVSNFGYPGTGLAGPATARGQAENEGGGGGGKSYLCGNYPGDCGGGGGGGGDYKSGAKGYLTGGGAQGGEGGARYAFDYDARWYLGAGGGGGAADPTGGGEAAGSGKNGTAGARGGARLRARGERRGRRGGARGRRRQRGERALAAPRGGGSGGAGAGGTVVFVGSFAAPATDVTGGQALNCDYCGGAGAAGRVVAEEGCRSPRRRSPAT